MSFEMEGFAVKNFIDATFRLTMVSMRKPFVICLHLPVYTLNLSFHWHARNISSEDIKKLTVSICGTVLYKQTEILPCAVQINFINTFPHYFK